MTDAPDIRDDAKRLIDQIPATLRLHPRHLLW